MIVIYAKGEDLAPARRWVAQQHGRARMAASEKAARFIAGLGLDRVIAVGGPALRDLRDVPGVDGIIGHDLTATCAALDALIL